MGPVLGCLQFSGDPLVEMMGGVIHHRGEYAAAEAGGMATALHSLDRVDVFGEHHAPGFQRGVTARGVAVVDRFLASKWYLDDINEKLFVQGSRRLARQVLEVDAKVVDGVVNLTGLLTLGSGEGLKYFETGRVQFYALIVFGGVIAMVALFGIFG
mgnify:CR=1 FL=1